MPDGQRSEVKRERPEPLIEIEAGLAVRRGGRVPPGLQRKIFISDASRNSSTEAGTPCASERNLTNLQPSGVAVQYDVGQLQDFQLCGCPT